MANKYIENQVNKILIHNKIHGLIQKIKQEELLNTISNPKL